MERISSSARSAFVIVLLVLWGIGIVCGVKAIWVHQMTPGDAGHALLGWPSDSRLSLSKDRPTLILVAHPHCPCTRASLRELEKVVTQAQQRVQVYVLFYKPTDLSLDWLHSDLWAQANHIPGVFPLQDDEGVEAGRFGANTSGHVLLYAPSGELLFSGGITGSRGHEGDNPGEIDLLSQIKNPSHSLETAPMFGCSIRTPKGSAP